jgi:hypothetical protein
MNEGSPVPDAIWEAIYAGHVASVVVFCDECGTEVRGDYTGETKEVRLATARQHLADTQGWRIEDNFDQCRKCADEEKSWLV